MYTTQELVDIFAKYYEAKDHLEGFLTDVIHAVGFHYIKNIEMTEENVIVTAEWHGSYQACDTEVFQFPVSLLENGKLAVIAHLKEKQDAEEKQKLAAKKDEVEKNDRAEYERLKKLGYLQLYPSRQEEQKHG